MLESPSQCSFLFEFERTTKVINKKIDTVSDRWLTLVQKNKDNDLINSSNISKYLSCLRVPNTVLISAIFVQY